MAIEYSRVHTKEELEEILVLQKQNLPDSLTEKEIEMEGFVTISHTFELLERMNAVCPHIIAKDKGRVIGYTLCMHPSFSKEIPILYSMFEKIREVHSEEESFIVMGQVCVDRAYRGQGVFRGLYKTMKKSLDASFKKIVTEVDGRNKRSLNAHLAIGFTTIKKYQSDGRDWYLIVL
jgi:predicted GNAT superfamily acetyltransferase